MNKRLLLIVVPVLVLALVTLGCKPPSLPFGSRETPTLGAAPATAKPGQPTAKPPAGLGELKSCEPGGYTYRLIPNYKHDTAGSTVTMVAEGGDADVGPLIMLGSSPLKGGQTAQTLYEEMKKTSNEMTFKDPKSITIGGFPALAIDFSGQTKSKELKGRVVLAVVSSDRYFMMIGGAPPAIWDKSLDDLFDAEIKVITFFEPKIPPTSTPRPTTIPAVRTPTQPVTGRTATPARTATTAGGAVIRQWAIFADASSEYGSDDWSAMQATGAPNTPKCGDNTTAWASQDPDETAWIELTYATPVRPSTIVIVQTYNPSSVVKVEIRDMNGKYTTVWSGAAEKKSGCPFYQSFSVSNQNFLVNGVKITLDQAKLGDWNEIDAVELVGTPASGGAPTQPGAGGQVYPKPPDAKIVVETPETVILTTKMNYSDAMNFYRNETKKIGLTERSGVTVISNMNFSMIFDGAAGGKSLIVQGVSMSDGTVMITMRYEKV